MTISFLNIMLQKPRYKARSPPIFCMIAILFGSMRNSCDVPVVDDDMEWFKPEVDAALSIDDYVPAFERMMRRSFKGEG